VYEDFEQFTEQAYAEVATAERISVNRRNAFERVRE
jgi:hypothetical protein